MYRMFGTQTSAGQMLVSHYYFLNLNSHKDVKNSDFSSKATWLINNISSVSQAVRWIRITRNNLEHDKVFKIISVLDSLIKEMFGSDPNTLSKRYAVFGNWDQNLVDEKELGMFKWAHPEDVGGK